jgi:hypothetical protein
MHGLYTAGIDADQRSAANANAQCDSNYCPNRYPATDGNAGYSYGDGCSYEYSSSNGDSSKRDHQANRQNPIGQTHKTPM